MVALPVALALTAALQSPTELKPLPGRPLLLEPFVIPANNLVNFDLLDARAELSNPPAPSEEPPRTVFGIKRHVGLGAGYDSGDPARQHWPVFDDRRAGPLEFRHSVSSCRIRPSARIRLQAEASGGENAINDSDQPGVRSLPGRLHQFPRDELVRQSRAGFRFARKPHRIAVRVLVQPQVDAAGGKVVRAECPPCRVCRATSALVRLIWPRSDGRDR